MCEVKRDPTLAPVISYIQQALFSPLEISVSTNLEPKSENQDLRCYGSQLSELSKKKKNPCPDPMWSIGVSKWERVFQVRFSVSLWVNYLIWPLDTRWGPLFPNAGRKMELAFVLGFVSVVPKKSSGLWWQEDYVLVDMKEFRVRHRSQVRARSEGNTESTAMTLLTLWPILT